MNCLECEHFEETCSKVEIYASGYAKECPHYGTDEPIISSTGCNIQILSEFIGHPAGLERVDITPMRKPGKSEWYSQVMICYNGHGTITTTREQNSLMGVSIWDGWKAALKQIEEINAPGLNRLVPLIQRRIQFDYSNVKYSGIARKNEPVEEKVDPPESKPFRLILPKNTDHLLDVFTQDSQGKSAGDQMDLFSL